MEGSESEQRPNKVPIYFPHVELFDRTLALAILTDRSRLHKVLAEVFLDFRVRICGGKIEQLRRKVKLVFLSMPSTWDFEEFLKSSKTKLVEPHKLHDDTILGSTTYIGRRAGKGYVDHLLENHQDGNSWGGNFSKSDLLIKNGRFEIRTSPNETADIENMTADFIKLTEILFELFGSAELEAPRYLHVFQADVVKKMGQYDVNTREFEVFQKYLSHHLAFKAPLVRATLFIEMWSIIRSECPINQVTGKRIPSRRLQNKSHLGFLGVRYFEETFKAGWFFNMVYYYDNPGNNRYIGHTLIQLLELIRHLEVHLTDHTRKDGVQLLPDIMLVDLMVEKTFDLLVPQLVYAMMLELNHAMFSSAWRHYEMFECGDELENSVSKIGKEKEVQSGGMNNSTSESVEAKSDKENAKGLIPSVVGGGSNTEELAPLSSAVSSVSLAQEVLSPKIWSEEGAQGQGS